MNVILFIHSWVRWLVVLIAGVALVKHALGWIQKTETYDSMSKGVMSGLSGGLDLQFLLGLILLILRWGGDESPWALVMDHAVPMLIAVVVGHLPSRWKELPASTRYRNNTLAILAIALLIVVGVAGVGNRWFFRGLAG